MISELLLVNPFSNTKLGRMFTYMSRIRADWKSRLSCTNLDALIQINQKDPDVFNFGAKESIN